MATKFHIKKNGEPGRCRALFGNCPLGGGDEDHYSSPEEARNAYEASMRNEELTATHKKQEEENEAQRKSEEVVGPDGETYPSKESMENHLKADAHRAPLYAKLKDPELVEDWRKAKINSFKWKVAQVVDSLQDGKISDEAFHATIEHMAAGEHSSLEANLKKNVEALVTRRYIDQMNTDYMNELKIIGIKSASSAFSDERLYSADIYEDAIESLKEEHELVTPLAESYYMRWFSKGE